MKSSLYVLIGHIICAFKYVTTSNSILKLGIRELEREKGEIFLQINEAIEDTINSLVKCNDSDANSGIGYMKDLKTQVAQFNGTELKPASKENYNSTEDTSGTNEYIISNLKELRKVKIGRRRAPKNSRTGYERIKEAILNFGSLQYGAQGIVSKKKQDRIANAIALQKTLDAWMEKREIEKRKIAAYKAQEARSRATIIIENCPDFGEAKKSGQRSRGTLMDKWPCCRKCCKNSYMGCF